YFPAADEVALVAGGNGALDCTSTVTSLGAGGVQVLTATSTVVTIPSGITLKSNTTTYDAFPSGTNILFQQTSAPTGWTKQTTHNDKALRVVSGTASSGGTVAFSTCFGRTATDSYTLLTADIPSHTHTNSLNDPGHTHTPPGA